MTDYALNGLSRITGLASENPLPVATLRVYGGKMIGSTAQYLHGSTYASDDFTGRALFHLPEASALCELLTFADGAADRSASAPAVQAELEAEGYPADMSAAIAQVASIDAPRHCVLDLWNAKVRGAQSAPVHTFHEVTHGSDSLTSSVYNLAHAYLINLQIEKESLRFTQETTPDTDSLVTTVLFELDDNVIDDLMAFLPPYCSYQELTDSEAQAACFMPGIVLLSIRRQHNAQGDTITYENFHYAITSPELSSDGICGERISFSFADFRTQNSVCMTLNRSHDLLTRTSSWVSSLQQYDDGSGVRSFYTLSSSPATDNSGSGAVWPSTAAMSVNTLMVPAAFTYFDDASIDSLVSSAQQIAWYSAFVKLSPLPETVMLAMSKLIMSLAGRKYDTVNWDHPATPIPYYPVAAVCSALLGGYSLSGSVWGNFMRTKAGTGKVCGHQSTGVSVGRIPKMNSDKVWGMYITDVDDEFTYHETSTIPVVTLARTTTHKDTPATGYPVFYNFKTGAELDATLQSFIDRDPGGAPAISAEARAELVANDMMAVYALPMSLTDQSFANSSFSRRRVQDIYLTADVTRVGTTEGGDPIYFPDAVKQMRDNGVFDTRYNVFYLPRGTTSDVAPVAVTVDVDGSISGNPGPSTDRQVALAIISRSISVTVAYTAALVTDQAWDASTMVTQELWDSQADARVASKISTYYDLGVNVSNAFEFARDPLAVNGEPLDPRSYVHISSQTYVDESLNPISEEMLVIPATGSVIDLAVAQSSFIPNGRKVLSALFNAMPAWFVPF
jgi:hypothetical protein